MKTAKRCAALRFFAFLLFLALVLPASGAGASETTVRVIQEGWHLVSFPYDFGSQTLDNIFSAISGYELVGYADGKLDTGFSAQALQTGKAFWLYAPGELMLTVPADPNLESAQIQLSKGWNLIGNPFKNYLPWDDNILVDGSIPVTSSESPVSELLSYATTNYAPVAGLQPDWGYWVKAGRDCALSFGQAPEPDPATPLQSHYVVARGGDLAAGPEYSEAAYDAALDEPAEMLMADLWLSGDAEAGSRKLFVAPDDDVSLLSNTYAAGDYISSDSAAYLEGLDTAVFWRHSTGDEGYPAASILDVGEFVARYAGTKPLILNYKASIFHDTDYKKSAIDILIQAIRDAGAESSVTAVIPIDIPLFGDKAAALQEAYELIDYFLASGSGIRKGLFPNLTGMDYYQKGQLDIDWTEFELMLNLYQDAYASDLHQMKLTQDILVMTEKGDTYQAIQSILNSNAPLDGFLTGDPVQTSFLLGEYGRIMRLLKGPYLQEVKKDSITVMWESNFPTPTRVDYGKDPDNLDATLAVSDPSSIHEATLANLDPGTKYYYRIHSLTLEEENGSFTTAPEPTESFTFAAYGDNRTSPTRHEEVAQAIFESEPDFVINTGDIVENGNTYSQWSDQMFDPIKAFSRTVPFYVSIGNHEVNSPFYYQYIHQPNNEAWYAIDYGNARFVFLDSNRQYNSFAPGSDQYQWLEAELASTEFQNAAWKIVSFHHPPWSVSWAPYHYGSDATAVRDYLVPLFEQYGVDLVLNGHTHAYERNEQNGIVYVITGGGGGPLESDCEIQNLPQNKVCHIDYHYSFITANGNSLQFEARLRDQTVFDSFELTK